MVDEAIRNVSTGLKERVVELRMSRKLLKPIFPDRQNADSASAKLESVSTLLSDRVSELPKIRSQVVSEVDIQWEREASNLAPGSEILEKVFASYGVRYQSEQDGRRIASLIEKEKIPSEMRMLIRKIVEPAAC